jgi:cyclic lactone autoinducer peptide
MKIKGEKNNLGVKILKKMVSNSLIFDANSATCLYIHQPKVPADLKKFSKINKE